MPRLARPIPNRDRLHGNHRRPLSPARQAIQACGVAFAAMNLPVNFTDQLKDMKPILDFPWLLAFDNDEHPSRRRLLTVSEFFSYTETQDAEFFRLLDKDGDGKVTTDDLKDYLRKYNLSPDYADQFIKRARGEKWWSSSITFQEFKSMVDDNESKMLRAFCLLEVGAKGSLDMKSLKGSLAKLELPATDSNARAMLRALGKAEDASIAYGEFRRFAILMPREMLMNDKKPNLAWFESATCVPIGGELERGPTTVQLLLRAALAGGLSSGLSTIMLYPLDTLKTLVQSVPGASVRSVVADIPNLGRQALYRGIIPAGAGAFSSHGIRTCAYEAGLIGLAAAGLPFLQAQPIASFLGTLVGTVVRIPCEVLKQQLQRGNHQNVQGALSAISKLDGTQGFFRGAGALMFREVPFYVAGMVLYEQYKRCFSGEYFSANSRNLSTTETIGIGALAGASASFITTPADVIKSRLMTTAAGSNVGTSQIIVELIQKEGVWALFKGAIPRAVWIAPLGAMNFAGYEIAKRAMGVSSPEAIPTSELGRDDGITAASRDPQASVEEPPGQPDSTAALPSGTDEQESTGSELKVGAVSDSRVDDVQHGCCGSASEGQGSTGQGKQEGNSSELAQIGWQWPWIRQPTAKCEVNG